MLAVRRSIVDPRGRGFEGSKVLFYPSRMIFFGSLVLRAFREEDTMAPGPRFFRASPAPEVREQ